MSFKRLKFTKDWTDPTDFPTVETDEVQVRKDMQQLHSEVRDYLNEDLLPAIEEEYVPGERTVNGHPLTGNVTVTKADLGLGSVDNTADMDKPVSTAQAAAIQAAVMGQIPDGSVGLAALDTEVSAAVTRAEEGGELDQKMEELAAEQADLFHAAQHAAGGSDPVTPAAIGAVKKSGDTMTGNLTISGESMPKLAIQNTSANTRSLIEVGSHYVQLMTQNVANDSTNYRNLVIRDSTVASINKGLQFAEKTDGATKTYDILHTGNLSDYISAAQTAAIDYTGTGGKSVSIVVGFVPKLVVIQELVNDGPDKFPLVLAGTGEWLGMSYNSYSNETEVFTVTVTEFGTTVTWSAYNASEAFNYSSSHDYRLIAIG